jgi:hypothetical protein
MTDSVADRTASLEAAGRFVASRGRLVDRRRFAHLFADAPASLVRDAVVAYRNADGGFGALEPDIRSDVSELIPTLYAFDVLHEAGIADPELTTGALDWLESIANDDGGVPFFRSATATPDVERSPWMQAHPGDPSSLHMTSALAGAAHRLHLEHPWLDRATAFVWEQIPHLDFGAAYEVHYVISFLDAVPDRQRAAQVLDALRPHVPEDGLNVREGVEGERLSPLIVAPHPGHAGRTLFSDAAIERTLDDLAAGQQDDGGWTFDWPPLNDAVVWEWRGAVTVNACRTLRAYGRL